MADSGVASAQAPCLQPSPRVNANHGCALTHLPPVLLPTGTGPGLTGMTVVAP